MINQGYKQTLLRASYMFVLILSSHLCRDHPRSFFPSGVSTKILYGLPSHKHTHTVHALPISFSLT
jgi:hypothetical protein